MNVIVKNIKYYKFLLIAFCLLINRLSAQTNLIPNPSLELYDICPDSVFPGYPNGTVQNWYNPTQSSPDYYNACVTSTSNAGVPYNFGGGGGFQFARTGSAYFGAALYVDSNSQASEYWQIQLIDSLKKDSLYLLSFYVNLQNTMKFSINEFNVLFSDTAIFYSSMSHIPFTPQLRNMQSICITDTLNWIKIKAYYVASGGEKFMTVGNFTNDTVLTKCSTGFGMVPYAYYYYDDFYLGRINDTTGVGELENNEISFSVYPNPVSDYIFIESKIQNANFILTDVTGRLLMQFNATGSRTQISVAHLPNGVYFVTNNRFCRKIVVQR